MGMLPIQIGIVGLLYPMLLNRHRATRRVAERIGFLATASSVVLVAGASLWLIHNHRAASTVIVVALPSLANSLVQTRVWFLAVVAEAGGNPMWISGVAVPANLLAVFTLLVPWPHHLAVSAMVCALVLGNLILWIVMLRRSIGRDVLVELPAHSDGLTRAGGWFFSKAAVGYGGLAVLQSLAVLLPVSAVTILNIAVKVVGSVVATTVNAVMPRLVHQGSDSAQPAMRFLKSILTVVVLITTIGTVAAELIRGREAAFTVLAVGMWVAGSSASAVAQRGAFRFLPPSASRLTLCVVPIVVAAAAASSRMPGFSLLALLCAYAAVDGFSGSLLLGALKQRLLCAAVLCCMSIEAVLWIASFR
ncbi:hypothetical protein [Flexivirga caeni]|uniref:hypothetical protein n=1 Tax=Flexivirga caeni TaxID=2294115 RepID=UPI0011CE1C9A|nr:hypothetical protein [Flexivirga caeni]